MCVWKVTRCLLPNGNHSFIKEIQYFKSIPCGSLNVITNIQRVRNYLKSQLSSNKYRASFPYIIQYDRLLSLLKVMCSQQRFPKGSTWLRSSASPGTYWKCKFSGPTPDLLKQKTLGGRPSNLGFHKDSDAHWSWRTTIYKVRLQRRLKYGLENAMLHLTLGPKWGPATKQSVKENSLVSHMESAGECPIV